MAPHEACDIRTVVMRQDPNISLLGGLKTCVPRKIDRFQPLRVRSCGHFCRGWVEGASRVKERGGLTGTGNRLDPE